MYDEENENIVFWSFVIITGIMLIANVAACIWSGTEVHKIMNNDTSILAIKYAKEAVATLFMGAIASIAVDAVSWIVPKSNVIKVTAILENSIHKCICIAMAVALNAITFANAVSSFIGAKDLLIKAGYSIVDMVLPWL